MTENNVSEKRVDRLCEGYLAAGRNQERNVICEWLVTIQGIPEDVRLRLVRGLMAGEHHRVIVSPLLAAENEVVHGMTCIPDPPDPGVSDDGQEATREADATVTIEDGQAVGTCQPS